MGRGGWVGEEGSGGEGWVGVGGRVWVWRGGVGSDPGAKGGVTIGVVFVPRLLSGQGVWVGRVGWGGDGA